MPDKALVRPRFCREGITSHSLIEKRQGLGGPSLLKAKDPNQMVGIEILRFLRKDLAA